jgi:hypothetical protein
MGNYSCRQRAHGLSRPEWKCSVLDPSCARREADKAQHLSLARHPEANSLVTTTQGFERNMTLHSNALGVIIPRHWHIGADKVLRRQVDKTPTVTAAPHARDCFGLIKRNAGILDTKGVESPRLQAEYNKILIVGYHHVATVNGDAGDGKRRPRPDAIELSGA